MVISDVDLGLLEEQRVNGTVLPLEDLIRDAYDSVIHCTDRDGEKPAEPQIAENANLQLPKGK